MEKTAMKQKVKLGKTGILTTILVVVSLVAMGVWPAVVYAPQYLRILLLVLCIGCLLSAAFYAPVSIEVTDSDLLIHRYIKTKRIPLSEIRSVELHYPVGAVRTCGAGGFFGNWGYFSEKGIGSYFAYYGDPADCFLVKLNNGRRYLLGCENPSLVVDAIREN